MFPLLAPRVGIGGPFGVDRWPRVTGLVSYPSSCRFYLRRTASRPPALSELIASKGSSPVCIRRLPNYRSLRGADALISRSGCDTGPIWRLVNSSFTAGLRLPHTGSQSQLAVYDRLRSPIDSESRISRASLGLRMIPPCSRPTAFAAVAMTPLTARLQGRSVRNNDDSHWSR